MMFGYKEGKLVVTRVMHIKFYVYIYIYIYMGCVNR